MLSSIDSKKIAYLIGFMSGDGNFCDGFGKRQSRMSLTTTDTDVAEWISKNIESFPMDNPKFNDNKEAGIFARLPSYTKTFNIKHSEFFNKYGILCKKSERSFNNIAKVNMRQFMLGLIDSDGCISFSERKDRNRITCKVSVSHPSLLLLGKVQTFLMDSLGIPSTIKPKGAEKCFVWGFSKITHVEKFCEWLYSDTRDVVLRRKWDKWQELKGLLVEKRHGGDCYPSEFTTSPQYFALVGGMSRFMFSVNGVEYPSATIAAKANDVDNKTIMRRCLQEDMGCSRRPKTEEEKQENQAYVKRQVKKLYAEWSEEQ